MQQVPYGHPAWIEVDLVQLRRNLSIIRQHVGPNTKILFPVKANAYGHGLVPVAKATADLVDYYGVSCLQEGSELRQANIKTPILVLGAIHLEQIPELIYYDLEITVSSLYKAKLLADMCNVLKQTVKIHLEVDTGMQRTGVRIATAPSLLEYMRSQQYFDLKGIYSHLATADDPQHPFSAQQINDFLQFLADQHLRDDPNILCHLANSAGTAYFPETHLDMVRPGILVYGYYPHQDLPENLTAIKPCFSLKAKVAYFKTIMAGQGVGYSHTYITNKQSRLLTIPVGYGDGYRRCLSNKGFVLLNGNRYPIIGNVCMDQFMVDIGEHSAYIGDVVTLIGQDQNHAITIEELSHAYGTITYETLCSFNQRLPRIYHDV